MAVYDKVLEAAIAASVAELPENDREAVGAYAEQIRRILAAGGKFAYLALAVVGSAAAAADELPDELELPTVDVEESVKEQFRDDVRKAGL